MVGSQSTTTSPRIDAHQRSIEQTLINTSSTNTSAIPCLLYLEELKDEYGLRAFDECPGCNVLVARHQRQPLSVDVNTSNSSQVNTSSTSPRSVNVAKAFRNLKSTHVLPVWKSATVCHVFLSELTRCLKNSEVPSDQWYRAFAYVTDDYMISDWIDRNIIEPHLSFDQAVEKFRSHFETAAATELLAQEYSRCQQKPNESVQSYADRFSNICSRRRIADDDKLAIQHFIEHLQPSTQRQYRTQVGFAKANGNSPKVDKLSDVINYAIALEVAAKGVDISSSSSSGSGSKKCIYHPNASSHSTNECRLKPNKSNQSTPSSKPKQSSHGSAVATKTITCYKCGGKGHYANKCTKPGASSTGTTSNHRPHTPSNNQSTFAKQHHTTTWKSNPPSLNAGNSNNFQRTHSGRPVQPPDRYTPSKYQGARQPSVHFADTSRNETSSTDINPTDNNDDVDHSSADINETEPQLSSVAISRARVSSSSATPQPLLIQSISPSLFSYPSKVLFKFNNYVYHTLIDTGATVSFIDKQLVDKFNIDIIPVTGTIYLAQNGTTSNRIGQTKDPLSIAALFISEHTDLPCLDFTHRFEVMPLRREHSFIIGTDLLSVLFPKNIPIEFYTKASSTNMHINTIAAKCPSSNIIDEINLTSSNADTSSMISELEGIGTTPDYEQPERTTLSTTPDDESLYSSQRLIIESDPGIVQALQVNSSLTGFCSLPESIVHLEIDPQHANKLYRKQYSIPESVMSAVTDIVNRWHDAGKICLAPPGCKYNSSLTTAPKKDSAGNVTGIRICLDTRAINKALVVDDKFQIPTIRSALEQLAGNSIFGEFDLAEAYLQFKLDEASQPLTAFTWNGRQYMFIGCPFGLSLLPSHFQRVMSFLFSDLSFTFPYLDNLPFASRTWSDHRDHALIIINRLNEYNLQIKPSSIKFGYSELRCLGHVISRKGVAINPDKLAFISQVPLPRTGAELQSFLGYATFLRQHVRHFADITGPLEAVKNQKEIIWTDTMKQCFELTKEALSRAPILKFPDYSRRFVIATDASNTGVGAVLFQPDDERNIITADNIVAIHSQKLRDAQRNYPAYKKELLAIVMALRKFHHFIWGRYDLIIITDHKPLTYMLSSESLSPALQQWIDVILDHRFTVIHRPGILNVLPDQLSRLYASMYSNTWGVPSTTMMSTDADGNLLINCHAVSTRSKSKVKSSVAPGGNPSDLTGKHIDSQKTLLIELEKRGKSAPPEQQRYELIQREHALGHFGREAIFQKLWSKNIWWPKIRNDIQTVVNNCDACNRFTVTKSGFNPASFITSNGPWEHIQIDCSVHLPPSPEGYTTLLVIIDVFTGFVILRAVRTTSADLIARELWEVFAVFGIPKILQSDNGPEFSNEVIRTLEKLVGIEHRYISPYNPRADGKVERAIGTITSIIKKLLHGSVQHWPLFVPFAQLTFNQKISSSTGSTPFSLMFGRKFNELTDHTNEQDEIKTINLDDWKAHQEKIASIIYPAISDKIKIVKDKMIKSLNKHRRLLKENAFPPGAVVMLIDPQYINDPSKKPKWEPKYVGPYTVVRRARNGAYVLKDATGDILDRHVPPDQMKLISRTARKSKKDKEIYVIEKIIKHRGTPGKYEYFVKWKNYDDTQNTWQPGSSFLDDTIIKEYWKNPFSDPT